MKGAFDVACFGEATNKPYQMIQDIKPEVTGPSEQLTGTSSGVAAFLSLTSVTASKTDESGYKPVCVVARYGFFEVLAEAGGVSASI